MKILAKPRKIRFSIEMGGELIYGNDYESFRRKFSISDIVPLINNRQLFKWFSQVGHTDVLKAMEEAFPEGTELSRFNEDDCVKIFKVFYPEISKDSSCLEEIEYNCREDKELLAKVRQLIDSFCAKNFNQFYLIGSGFSKLNTEQQRKYLALLKSYLIRVKDSLNNHYTVDIQLFNDEYKLLKDFWILYNEFVNLYDSVLYKDNMVPYILHNTEHSQLFIKQFWRLVYALSLEGKQNWIEARNQYALYECDYSEVAKRFEAINIEFPDLNISNSDLNTFLGNDFSWNLGFRERLKILALNYFYMN